MTETALPHRFETPANRIPAFPQNSEAFRTALQTLQISATRANTRANPDAFARRLKSRRQLTPARSLGGLQPGAGARKLALRLRSWLPISGRIQSAQASTLRAEAPPVQTCHHRSRTWPGRALRRPAATTLSAPPSTGATAASQNQRFRAAAPAPG